MDLIEKNAIALHPPNDDSLQASYQRVRALYKIAYGTEPSDAFEAERGAHRVMRSYVRRWISTWDLERLYPTESQHPEEEAVTSRYDEDADLGVDSDEGSNERT